VSAARSLAQANRRLAGKLFLLTVAMFGFGYALVPLYSVFCQLTGLNGTTGRANAQAVQASHVDSSRWVTVEFTGQVMGNLPWEFRPLQKKIRLHPGDTAVVKYYARNLANETIVGRAIPSVAPNKAAPHFKKIECFCFSQQELKAGQGEEMPVRFLLERDLPKDVNTLTLSYAFYYVDRAQAATADDGVRPGAQRGQSRVETGKGPGGRS
jgi:cytochrome c oxidase assembly protein subunit 11